MGHPYIALSLLRRLAFCALLPLGACGGSGCDEEMLDEFASPDGRYVAAVFERRCDVDSSEDPIIRYVTARLIDAEGYGEDPMKTAIYIAAGEQELSAAWIQPGWLAIISSAPPDQVIQWSANWQDVIIVYQ
ncbi:MAG: hypothetical protein WD715_13245 [Dongiaceae bacterium]